MRRLCPQVDSCRWPAVGMLLVATMLLAPAMIVRADEAPLEDGFTRLFDGKTFDKWEGNLKIFRIEDGAIVAGTLKANIPRNEFLCTTQEFGNFELRLQFKMLGAGANAGIQFHSQRIPNHHETIGYQADLGDGWYGVLYDESRRNRVLAKPDGHELDKVLKRGEWNDYVIRAENGHIQLWINGLQTVDYKEADANIPQRGIIGLQIHSGKPSEAHYRNIRIKAL